VEAQLRSLARTASSRPLLVEITAGRHSLIIGLGTSDVILTIMEREEDGSGREWISVGDVNRPGEVEYAFVGGEISEFEARQLIPFEVALAAVREFLESGDIPKTTRWEENVF